jgi:hypothetical protein
MIFIMERMDRNNMQIYKTKASPMALEEEIIN